MSADIDIDIGDRSQLLKLIKHTAARQLHMGQPRHHNSGIYVTDIPYDPILDCSNITYQEAEERGYFKIDILNVSVYQMISDQEHYDRLLSTEPPWDRLGHDKVFTEKLIHVGSYGNLLKQMKPDSILKMAAFISIIRPGKAHLQNKSWDEIFETVWDKDDSHGFVFKKSHSISYGALVALHMNLINELNSSD